MAARRGMSEPRTGGKGGKAGGAYVAVAVEQDWLER
jgi:hypothetical protein